MKLLRALSAAMGLSMFSIAAASAGDSWTHDGADDRIGRIYYYERSNRDGTVDERVTVFRRSTAELEVYKENGLCVSAALVTARLDLGTLSATQITGGRLLPDAQHAEFAFLEATPANDQLSMLVQLPNVEIRNTAPIKHPHWQLYDFDLATLTVAAPHIDNRQGGFDFGMALLWADPSAADPLTWMGDVEANFIGAEQHLARNTERYRLSGTAFSASDGVDSEGTLWLDAAEGFVVDAEFPVPNHPGYSDFRLRLLKISDGGLQEWNDLLTAHFGDCGD